MLPPVQVDMAVVLRHVMRLQPSLCFCPRLRQRLGCHRHVSTLRLSKRPPLPPPCLTLLPSLTVQSSSFKTSVSCHWRMTGLFGMATDPPDKTPASVAGDTVPSSASASSRAASGGESGGKDGGGSQGTGMEVAGGSGSAAKDEEGSAGKVYKVLKVTPKPRKVKPLEYSYTGNIYILPVRAMNEYLLKPNDLEGLPKYERRSPYESGPKITVYLRTDVETIARQVWGSLENLVKEKNRRYKRNNSKKWFVLTDDLFQIRALLDQHKGQPSSGIGDDRPYLMGEEPKVQRQQSLFWKSGSARVVMSAILVNGLNSVMKLIAWLYTGSHSMFAEFVHSVADTMNQIILGVGLYHSIKKPDPDHPYGYSNLRHISSLISGVGIFFFGTGLSFYHGFQGFMHPEPLTSLNWGIATLVGAFLSEGATLIIAINQVRKSSAAMGIDFWQYVHQGVDPNVSVVLLEDMAAVVGVGVAGVCMMATQYVGTTVPDALGSCIIGSLLGLVASYVISTNTSTLVGKSVPFPVRQGISEELEGDRMIRSLHDVKATHMGGEIRFKAEVDFDGKEITRAYLYKQDLDLLLAEMNELQTAEQVEAFMLTHGERIVDSLGEEVDRIEKLLKKKYPDLRHVDLEAL